MRYKQYAVLIVNHNPTKELSGLEIQKTRPYLVISLDEINYFNIIVAPMTSKKKKIDEVKQMIKTMLVD